MQRAEFNKQPTPPIPITYSVVTGTGKGFSTGVQQAGIVVLYWDQVRQAGLEAWATLEEGPTESPITGMMQKPAELLLDFIERKLPPHGLRDQFTMLLVWEGMNQDTRMGCAGIREGSMSQ